MTTHRANQSAALILVLFTAACRTAAPVTTPATPPAKPAAAFSSTDLLNGVLWIQTAAESEALMRQTYLLATRNLDTALADPTWTAAVEQTGDFSKLPPAVIVDVDETVIDNSVLEARLLKIGKTFDQGVWKKWVDEAAGTPIPGALEFAKYAEAHGVTMFYVTNRETDEEPSTRRNLLRAGFPVREDIDVVLMRGEIDKTRDKASRRAMIGSKFRILLLLGDDLGDFTSPDGTIEERRARARHYAEMWGRKWIMIADPIYGSWEKALYLGAPNGDDAAKHQRRMDMLRTEP